MKKLLSINLGITSIGYSVLNELDNDKYSLIDYGVNMFDTPYDKDGNSKKLIHSQIKSTKKLYELRKERKKNLSKLFEDFGFAKKEDFLNQEKENLFINKWGLRAKKAFEEKLTFQELFSILYLIAKHRGYKSLDTDDLLEEFCEKLGLNQEKKKDNGKDNEKGKIKQALKTIETLKLQFPQKTIPQIIYEVEIQKENPTFRNHDNYNYMIRREYINEEIKALVLSQEKFGLFDKNFDSKAFIEKLIETIDDQKESSNDLSLFGNCEYLKNEKVAHQYSLLGDIYKMYQQLQYATNIKHIAHDIYYWLNREFRIDNMVFTLFNINKNEKEDIYIEGEHFYLDDEFSNFFIINTDTSINATVSFRAISKVHNRIIQDQFYIIDAAFHLISPIIQNGVLKKDYIESSSIDSVTNVYNRSYLVKHLNKHLSLTRNKQSQIYFLMIGIDRFKAVIDEFNHDIGDIVLIELAKIIHSNITQFDMVGRLTGDEFLVTLFSIENESEVNSIAHKIMADFAQTNIIVNEKTNQILKKTICIGINKHTIIDERDISETIKNADIALYEAKNKGRSTFFNYKDLRIEDSIDLF